MIYFKLSDAEKQRDKEKNHIDSVLSKIDFERNYKCTQKIETKKSENNSF